jgi:hypothetical protein
MRIRGDGRREGVRRVSARRTASTSRVMASARACVTGVSFPFARARSLASSLMRSRRAVSTASGNRGMLGSVDVLHQRIRLVSHRFDARSANLTKRPYNSPRATRHIDGGDPLPGVSVRDRGHGRRSPGHQAGVGHWAFEVSCEHRHTVFTIDVVNCSRSASDLSTCARRRSSLEKEPSPPYVASPGGCLIRLGPGQDAAIQVDEPINPRLLWPHRAPHYTSDRRVLAFGFDHGWPQRHCVEPHTLEGPLLSFVDRSKQAPASPEARRDDAQMRATFAKFGK